jgi:hypothetical protein
VLDFLTTPFKYRVYGSCFICFGVLDDGETELFVSVKYELSNELTVEGDDDWRYREFVLEAIKVRGELNVSSVSSFFTFEFSFLFVELYYKNKV